MEMTEKIEAIEHWLGSGAINIFGLPFSGKDTHGNYLSDLLNAPLLGGGDILRNSEIPERSREAMKMGNLIPTDDYISIVLPYLASEQFANKPLILSSVGRWDGEQQGVVAAAQASGHPIKAAIYLRISIQTANERFNKSQIIGDRNREDDAKEKLIVRFSEFEEKTLPVIEYYRQAGMLIDINGNPPVDEVRAVIIDSLYEMSQG